VRSPRIARRINPALYQRPFRIELARLDQFSNRSQATESAYEWTRTSPLKWLLLMAHRDILRRRAISIVNGMKRKSSGR
jgi:hypothetical protein